MFAVTAPIHVLPCDRRVASSDPWVDTWLSATAAGVHCGCHDVRHCTACDATAMGTGRFNVGRSAPPCATHEPPHVSCESHPSISESQPELFGVRPERLCAKGRGTFRSD